MTRSAPTLEQCTWPNARRSICQLAELEIGTRYANILEDNGIYGCFGDVLDRLGEDDDENSILAIQGIGRKVVSDMKKNRCAARGYQLNN